MGQPLRLREIRLPSLEIVADCAKCILSLLPLVNVSRALERRSDLIGGERQQELFRSVRKAASFAGHSESSGLTAEANR